MKSKEKAVKAWSAILTILALKQDTSIHVVDKHLQNTPRPHVLAVQAIVEWSGAASSDFKVNGDWDEPSQWSLNAIYDVKNGISELQL